MDGVVRSPLFDLDTVEAFDRVAHDYDGESGNNALVQSIRRALWREVAVRQPAPARLLDLGCGTGIDAAHFARSGYTVTAVDPSEQMVAQAGRRAVQMGARRLTVSRLTSDAAIDADVPFDCIYSNLGALNCMPAVGDRAHWLASTLKPGGLLIASVINRWCPWDIVYCLATARLGRLGVRFARGATPVPLGSGTVWTRYYTPRQLSDALLPHFDVVTFRGLAIFGPPPYLIGIQRRAPGLCARMDMIDRVVGALPGVRNLGDHFLMVLRRR